MITNWSGFLKENLRLPTGGGMGDEDEADGEGDGNENGDVVGTTKIQEAAQSVQFPLYDVRFLPLAGICTLLSILFSYRFRTRFTTNAQP